MNKTEVESAVLGCWSCGKPPDVHRAQTITRIFCRHQYCPIWPTVSARTPEEAVELWNEMKGDEPHYG